MKYRGEGISRIPREFRKGNLSSVLRAQTNFQEKSIAFVSHFARIFFCDEFSGMIFRHMSSCELEGLGRRGLLSF